MSTRPSTSRALQSWGGGSGALPLLPRDGRLVDSGRWGGVLGSGLVAAWGGRVLCHRRPALPGTRLGVGVFIENQCREQSVNFFMDSSLNFFTNRIRKKLPT